MNPPSDALLVFNIGEQRLALSAISIERVIRAVAVSRPIRPSPALLGLINYGGKTLPVLNLRHSLGMPPRDIDPSDRMIIANTKDHSIVLWVDDVGEITEFKTDFINKTALVSTETTGICGTIADEEGLIYICDPEALLTQMNDTWSKNPIKAERVDDPTRFGATDQANP